MPPLLEVVFECSGALVFVHAFAEIHRDDLRGRVLCLLVSLPVWALAKGLSPWLATAGMLLLACASHHVFLKRRPRIRVRRPGVYFWARLVGAAVCAYFAISVATTPIRAKGQPCGSLEDTEQEAASPACKTKGRGVSFVLFLWTASGLVLVRSAFRGGEATPPESAPAPTAAGE